MKGMSKKEHQDPIEAAYAKIRSKHPDASDYEIEQAVRSYLLKRKMKRIGLLFLVSGCIMLISISINPHAIDNPFLGLLLSYGKVLGPFGEIASIFMFSAVLHDPLTPNEAEELRRRDAVEKSGQREKTVTDVTETLLTEEEREKKEQYKKEYIARQEIEERFMKENKKSRIWPAAIIGIPFWAMWIPMLWLSLGFLVCVLVFGFLYVFVLWVIISDNRTKKEKIENLRNHGLHMLSLKTERKRIVEEKDPEDGLIRKYTVELSNGQSYATNANEFQLLQPGDIIYGVFIGTEDKATYFYPAYKYELGEE